MSYALHALDLGYPKNSLDTFAQNGILFCQFESIAILLVFVHSKSFAQNFIELICWWSIVWLNVHCSRWKGVTSWIFVCNYELFDDALQNYPFSRWWNEKDKKKIARLKEKKKTIIKRQDKKKQQPNDVMIMMMMNWKR